MDNVRTGQSKIGVASLVLALIPALVFMVAVPMIVIYTNSIPPGADVTAIGFGVLMLMFTSVLVEIIAVALGLAGALQRQRGRLYALVGIACSSLALLALAFYFIVARV
ncbi:hypothetical protein BH23ACT11_BH23ACT11_08170 [soil metagenome]